MSEYPKAFDSLDTQYDVGVDMAKSRPIFMGDLHASQRNHRDDALDATIASMASVATLPLRACSTEDLEEELHRRRVNAKNGTSEGIISKHFGVSGIIPSYSSELIKQLFEPSENKKKITPTEHSIRSIQTPKSSLADQFVFPKKTMDRLKEQYDKTFAPHPLLNQNGDSFIDYGDRMFDIIIDSFDSPTGKPPGTPEFTINVQKNRYGQTVGHTVIAEPAVPGTTKIEKDDFDSFIAECLGEELQKQELPPPPKTEEEIAEDAAERFVEKALN